MADKIKRWIPVSQDINRDPEVWELTERFGDRAIRVWLECLSIADRAAGQLPGSPHSVATVCAMSGRMTRKKCLAILEFAQNKGWISSDMPLRIVKYADYHKIRERTSFQPSAPFVHDIVRLPTTPPNHPSLTTQSPKVLSNDQDGKRREIEGAKTWEPALDTPLGPAMKALVDAFTNRVSTPPPTPVDPEARCQLLRQQAATLIEAEKLEKEKRDDTV